MQFELKIDNSCKEPKIIIITDKMTNEKTSFFTWTFGISSWDSNGLHHNHHCIYDLGTRILFCVCSFSY